MNIQIVLGFLFVSYVLCVPMTIVDETIVTIMEPFDQEECNQTSLLNMRYYVPTNITSEYIECVSFGKGFKKECENGTVFCIETANCISEDSASVKEKIDDLSMETTTMSITKRHHTKEHIMLLETTTMMQENSTDVEMESMPIVKTGDVVENMTMNSTKSLEIMPFILTTTMESTTVTTKRNDKRHRYRHRNFNKRSNSLNRRDWIRVSIDVPNCMNNCQNGMCDEFSTTSRCICLVGYTGEKCETLIENKFDYKEMLENTFTMKSYIVNHYFENGTAKNMDISMTNTTSDEIVSVNSLVAVSADNTYERFWTEMVDHLWSEILPEHHFMRNFTCDQFSESKIGSDLQRLFYFSKYIEENFETRMEVMETVLSKMKSLLQQQGSLVKKDALSFLTEWKNYLIDNGSSKVKGDKQLRVRKVSQSQLMKEMTDQMEKTFTLTRSLYEKFLTRQEEDIMEDPERVAELKEVFEEVKMSSMKSWNMVVDYGFWFLTYNLAVKGQSEKLAIDKLMRENLDFYTRMEHEHHHHHVMKQAQF